ncbi:MAG: hypothetical protein ACT4QE_13200, partial [Anaerolineales bacterium]
MSINLDLDDQDFRAVRARAELRRRRISENQMVAFESHIAEILAAFGLDLNTPATRETPQRFV